ncbi:MAG: hypothetical protein A2Y12_20755, partial [Planctomycetes bacterium GWF2_42_9]
NRLVQELHALRYPEYFKPYDYPSVLESITGMLAQEKWYAFVARIDNILAGYVLFYIRDYAENPFRYAYRGIHIDQIAVLEEYQHQHVGSSLMDKVESFARSQGISRLELTYWDKNTEAGSFYAKRGFVNGLHFVAKEW